MRRNSPEMVWRSFGRKAVGVEFGGIGSPDGTDDWRSTAERQQFPARRPKCAAKHYGPTGVWIPDVGVAGEWFGKHLRGQRPAAECAGRAQRNVEPGHREPAEPDPAGRAGKSFDSRSRSGAGTAAPEQCAKSGWSSATGGSLRPEKRGRGAGICHPRQYHLHPGAGDGAGQEPSSGGGFDVSRFPHIRERPAAAHLFFQRRSRANVGGLRDRPEYLPTATA
jgi:hypothetical protein